MAVTPGPDRWEGAERRRPRIGVLAGLVLVAAVGVAAAVGAGLLDGAPGELVVEETDAPIEAATVGVVEPLPAAPLSGRLGMAHAWTGQELLLWGGQAPPAEASEPDPGALPLPLRGLLADGAAFDPATERWRALPDAPLAPRVEPAFAWTGDRLFVWGGADEDFAPLDDGAVYLPADDRWEPLPPAPIEPRMSAAAVWTGTEVLVLGGFAVDRAQPSVPVSPASQGGAAFDPVTGTWRAVPAQPDGLDLSAASPHAWTGAGLVVWDRSRAVVHLPDADRWEPLTSAGALHAPEWVALAALPEGRAVLLGARPREAPDASGVVLDATGAVVETLPAGGPGWPGDPVRLVVTDEDVAAFPFGAGPASERPPRALLWNRAGQRWEALPEEMADRGDGAIVWTGQHLLLWGGSDGRRAHADGLRWQPVEVVPPE